MNLTERIVAVHEALEAGGIPHAFGGALALAWCTSRPRATIGISVSLFVTKVHAVGALQALPHGVSVRPEDQRAIARDGQARLRWGQTPIDVFLNTTSFHDDEAQRVRREAFGGARIPFLACGDLAVFKAFFDRSQDWVDLEGMVASEAFDVEEAAEMLARYLGADDHRVLRLRSL